MPKVCLTSKLISWSDIVFDMNNAMASSKCLNLNIRLVCQFNRFEYTGCVDSNLRMKTGCSF